MSEEEPTPEFIQELENKYTDALQQSLRAIENALEIPICVKAEFRTYNEGRMGLVLWYQDEEEEQQEIEIYWNTGSNEARGHELDQIYAYQLGLEAIKAYKNKFL